jgi:signal transduction histidine kinase
MSLTKKKEKKSSVPQMDLEIKLASISKETKKLELAYDALQKQFYALKEKLECSLHTFEQMVAHLAEGLLFVTLEEKIAICNPAAAQLLDMRREKVLNSFYSEHFSDCVFGFSMKEALKKAFSNQRALLTLDNGKDLEICASKVPNRGVVLLLSDRSEEQKFSKSLQQAERLKEIGEMAATLAHEIRNPLGGIEGLARLLKRDLEAPSHQRMVQSILEGTGALSRLVSEVLDYARPFSLHFAPVDLVAFIKGTLELASASSEMPKCIFQSSHMHYMLSIDKEKIQRVVLNVLRNAFEAEATLVEICLTQEGTIIFKDNGKGICPKNLEKIFTPFFTTKTHGSGLGLAHSLAIIKAHDGILDVASQEGQGTKITIKL